ncbi:hypothetical protein DSAG12_01927 [Promethearchaeum syntrophicum]|uniref:Uncharacterized protein n=1 Tax=Promethearchaeum syntrophicum TaxID=2594042 RepID=A0A5B9DA05_9ARCH|nr:hypothetical protein [Candidatus Prometheoarchaeum syntrophicum]
MIKIRELESYLEELDEMLPDDERNFLKSLEKRRATEHELQIMTKKNQSMSLFDELIA